MSPYGDPGDVGDNKRDMDTRLDGVYRRLFDKDVDMLVTLQSGVVALNTIANTLVLWPTSS